MEDVDDHLSTDETETAASHAAGFGVAAGLLVVAFVGAVTADVFDAVGAYLLGVSVLVAALYLLGRRRP